MKLCEQGHEPVAYDDGPNPNLDPLPCPVCAAQEERDQAYITIQLAIQERDEARAELAALKRTPRVDQITAQGRSPLLRPAQGPTATAARKEVADGKA